MIDKTMVAVVDTECVGLQDKSVYDFGYVIQDRTGNQVFEAAHLVEEIVTDADKMTGAFYAKKIFSHYLPLVDAGLIDIRPFKYIQEEFLDVCSTYKVNVFSAYNLGFDAGALRHTSSILANSKFLNYVPKLLDIWQFACETILNRPTYRNMAQQYNWISEAGNLRTNAECAYRYVTHQPEAVEAHTALCDARIEGEILAQCFRQKKTVPYGVMNAQPWRIVNA